MGRKKGVGYTAAERAKRAATKARKAAVRQHRALQAAETRHVNRCLAENLAAFKADQRAQKRLSGRAYHVGFSAFLENAAVLRSEGIGGTQ